MSCAGLRQLVEQVQSDTDDCAAAGDVAGCAKLALELRALARAVEYRGHGIRARLAGRIGEAGSHEGTSERLFARCRREAGGD